MPFSVKSVTASAPLFATSSFALNRYLSSTAMVRRKVSPSPLSQMSVMGFAWVSGPVPSCCQTVSAPGSFAAPAAS